VNGGDDTGEGRGLLPRFTLKDGNAFLLADALGDIQGRDDGLFVNEWIDKSRSDLALLTTSLETGPYPYAGIPWFATQFGRDAIITAMQTLWVNPGLAAGVLAVGAGDSNRRPPQGSAYRAPGPAHRNRVTGNHGPENR
jgi:hypothetical protein